MKTHFFKKIKGFTPHLLRRQKQNKVSLTPKKGAGFTLIELLVVIAIIGLISTLAAVALNTARQKGRDAKRVADTKEIQTALEMHFQTKEVYPRTTGWVALGYGSYGCLDGNTTGWHAAGSCSSPLFMGRVTADPLSPKTTPPDATFEYFYRSESTWGKDCYIMGIYIESGAGELDANDAWYFDPNSYAQKTGAADANGDSIPDVLCSPDT